jgi:hypothetical protein
MPFNFTDSNGSKYSIELIDNDPWETFRIRFQHKTSYGYSGGIIKAIVISERVMMENPQYLSQEAINFIERIWKNRAFL